MPVTARLSKKLYDKLGDDIAAELVEWFNSVDATFRSDLRELIDLNFQRFDAKLEQRLAEFRAEMRIEMASLEKSLIRWMFVFWVGALASLIGVTVALR